MQLKNKLSIITACAIITSNAMAEDYVRVNVLQYNENDNRVSVTAPGIEINKELGVDWTVNASIVGDSVSGGTPIYIDSSSGASAYSGKGTGVSVNDIENTNVDMSENRMFANIGVTQRLENRDELTYGFTKSYESDFDSNTLSLGYKIWDGNSKNLAINLGLAYSFNEVLIKDCSYNSTCGTPDSVSGASQAETNNQLVGEFGITKILSPHSSFDFGLFYSNEDGYLSNPYYTVVRNNNGTTADVVAENRPDSRMGYGIKLAYKGQLSSNIISSFKYRFYIDDWDISSHTFENNNFYQYNDNIKFGFGFRYYTQSEADFYNASNNYFTNEEFASSDERLSSFNSYTLNGSVEYKYSDKLSYNLGLSWYNQSTDLSASTINIGAKYKF